MANPETTAIFSNGCFWGTQQHFDHQFKNKGIINSEVGYIGGHTDAPTYRQVCSGTTGHAEALKIEFDPEQVSYAQLVKFHYQMHDPTDRGGQGPDRGSQYRSGIFTLSDEQDKIAKDVTAEVQKKYFDPKNKKIVTEITNASDLKWWKAEDYHQDYLDINVHGYECPAHYIRKWDD